MASPRETAEIWVSADHPRAAPTVARSLQRQRARELAWRYFLQDTALNHVLYCGNSDSETYKALQEEAASVGYYDPSSRTPPSTAPGSRFDLLVLQNIPRGGLHGVLKQVRIGGEVVLDMDLKRQLVNAKGLAAACRSLGWVLPRTCRRRMQNLGLEQIRLFWRVPSKNLSVRFVQMERPSISFFFSCRQRSVQAALAAITARLLLAVGIVLPVSGSYVATGTRRCSG